MKKYARALALGLVATQLAGCATTTTVEAHKSSHVNQTLEHSSKSSEESSENKEDTDMIKESKVENEVGDDKSSIEVGQSGDLNFDFDNLDDKDRYSLELYKALYNKEENFIFSPYSIADCFSLIYDGTSGETRKELDKYLGFSSRDAKFYRYYDNQTVYYDGKGVKVANKGYINTKYDDMLNKDILGTDNLETIEMDSKAADVMNKFIDENTEGKIKDLISKDSINDDLAMVLINALYFKKSWDFNEWTVRWNGKTDYKGFSGSTNTANVKEVTPDIDVLRLCYDEDIDYNKLYEIDGEAKQEEFRNKYDQNRYAMYIICNNVNSKEEKVDEYISGLDDDTLREVLDFGGYTGLGGYNDVSFEVPNFEINNKASIANGLKNMGVKAAFVEGSSDFSKIGPVHIDDVLHGAYVKVDNKGTEAAAATALMVAFDECAILDDEIKTKEVKADETFVFIIKDETNDNILFMGRVVEPTEKE